MLSDKHVSNCLLVSVVENVEYNKENSEYVWGNIQHSVEAVI